MIVIQRDREPRGRIGLCLGLGLTVILTSGCGPKYFQVPVQVTGKSGEAISSAYLTPVPESYQGKNRGYIAGFLTDENGLATVDSLLKRDPVRVVLDFPGNQWLYESDTLKIDLSRKYTLDQPFKFEADSVAGVTTQPTVLPAVGDVKKNQGSKFNRVR